MKDWIKRYPPYEGEEPYMYLAFAQAGSTRSCRSCTLPTATR